MSDALDRLCDLTGVQRHYLDVWKNPHHVSDETKRALVSAMGVDSSTDALEDSLRQLEERSWRRALPPVMSFDEGSAIEVPVALPQGTASIAWRVTTEGDTEYAGNISVAEMALLESASPDGKSYDRRFLILPLSLPTGYHRLRIGDGPDRDEMRLIVAPERCWTVEDATKTGRVWGVAAQIYSLRSDRNWGLGDFTDLADTAEQAAGLGADIIGINPVHALFYDDPHHVAPYAPSNRAYLHYLYIDLTALPELACCPGVRDAIAQGDFQASLRWVRGEDLVDYIAVAKLKRPLLEQLYDCFVAETREGGSLESHRARFERFRTEMGHALELHARFEALHEHFFDGGKGQWSWQEWPEPYRRCDSDEVAAFAATNRERVDFFAWLQWCADRQLGHAHERALSAGMRLGLYRDLAVAAHGSGSAAWMHPSLFLYGASAGAPPDELGPEGQNWGITPLSPFAMRETGYEPFITALRANMRHAGALRIDHAMVLERLFCIPAGMTGGAGAYIQYPLSDLLRIIALESRRARCIVIGEDLGTVPEGFRPALQRVGILSYRIFMFERADDGGFKPTDEYPRQALVAPSTHDLPTLAGFWAGRDLDWREKLSPGLPESERLRIRVQRQNDRASLLRALTAVGADVPDELGAEELRAAMYRFLASTPANLLLIPIEDLAGEIEQPNLPGTTDDHPNWRRKLKRPTEAIFADPAVQQLARTVTLLRHDETTTA